MAAWARCQEMGRRRVGQEGGAHARKCVRQNNPIDRPKVKTSDAGGPLSKAKIAGMRMDSLGHRL